MRRLLAPLLIVALSGGFYLVLIDTADLPELYAMCGVVLLALIAFQASRAQGFTEASISLKSLSSAWRPLAQVPVDIGTLTGVALAQLAAGKRGPVGTFRAVRFKGGDSEADRGRQALAEAFGSLAPNTIVIGIDPDRELLLVHQLRRQGGREELDVMRLG